MDIETKMDLILREPTEEVITREDLKKLLEVNPNPNHYIGFEISGLVHLGTGFMCMAKVKDLLDAGCKCSIWLADLHTYINRKLGGDLETIKKVAGGYFKNALMATLECLGAKSEKVKFLLGSETYNQEFWIKTLQVSREFTLNRVMRMGTIMGREEREMNEFARLIYPPMQIADIFFLNIDIAHGGTDQRKAQVAAREVAPAINEKKPICLHHHLLQGLVAPSVWPIPKNIDRREILISCKMSKSKPKTCIFIHDPPQEIKEKIKNAWCPERILEFNPITDIVRYVIFKVQKNFEIKRPEKYGSTIEFNSPEEFEKAYGEGKIHPLDLKNSVSEELIKILEPVRKYFEKPKIKEMKEQLEKMRISR